MRPALLPQVRGTLCPLPSTAPVTLLVIIFSLILQSVKIQCSVSAWVPFCLASLSQFYPLPSLALPAPHIAISWMCTCALSHHFSILLTHPPTHPPTIHPSVQAFPMQPCPNQPAWRLASIPANRPSVHLSILPSTHPTSHPSTHTTSHLTS